MIFDHISEAIKLPSIIRLEKNLYVARFESMKVYSVSTAVQSLLDAGSIDQTTTLIDSSSGVYAYALALACNRFGLKCHIVGSSTVDLALLLQLRILGATVEQVPAEGSLKLDQHRRVSRVKEIVGKRPSYYWMRQYHDAIHYLGYKPLADIIAAQIGAENLTVVGSIGSGCSTGGLTEALRVYQSDVRLIGIQPFGSVTFGSEHVDDPGIAMAGMGSGIPFENVRPELYDEMHWVSLGYGLSGAVALLRRHAVFAGLSSGCCYLVAKREADRSPNQNVIFIAPDTGHRYVDTVFARHGEALPLEALSPIEISSQEMLDLPWAYMPWLRRPYRVNEE
ncbi:pyridoxal-phosphate dependent enzyme [Sphingomonas sp. Leaf242]|uniref:pyridoxal-phosphate dependent enzyme n=1 Tax=Sphingomonas sp. Leaf242 TaxID=1736304 RepID=UPI00071361BA|nr:pyridoxal-phosphate dependent enzyme [Sphingomonas sp. Leaf242]KQO12200.1 cysteine synthase [Sphingomonas sp. Leaf242]